MEKVVYDLQYLKHQYVPGYIVDELPGTTFFEKQTVANMRKHHCWERWVLCFGSIKVFPQNFIPM